MQPIIYSCTCVWIYLSDFCSYALIWEEIYIEHPELSKIMGQAMIWQDWTHEPVYIAATWLQLAWGSREL